MEPEAIIDDYIQEVASHLPRRLRNDVGLELRDLVAEHLKDAARGAGRAIDNDMAIEVLRRFGRPEEVAARYAPRGFELIEAQLVPWFLKIAVMGVILQWALSLPRVFALQLSIGDWWARWSVNGLAWIGLLVIWFGMATWVRRRIPVNPDTQLRHWSHYFFWVPTTTDWRPVDREAIERRAARGAFPLGVVATTFFIAPAWFVGLFAAAGANPSWVAYDAYFQRRMLVPLLVLMAVRLVLFAAVARNERWRAPTDAIRFALWVGFVVVLVWALFGHIFANRIADSLFKAWLTIFLLVNTIQIVVWIYRKVTRVRAPGSLANLK